MTDPMKIAWFSPLVPVHSEIANHTERLRPELERRFETRLFTERPEGFVEPASGTLYPCGVGHCPHALLPVLNQVDVPIYNLGNNPDFFAKTWFLNQMKPGVVILHDTKLHHFFEGIYRQIFQDETAYLRVMEEQYGEAGRASGWEYCRQRLSIEHMAEHFPMTAWAIQNALAVIVHTPHSLKVVHSLTRSPAWMVPLPYAAEPGLALEDAAAPEAFSRERRARLIVFGYLNVNRRIIELLSALAEMPERNLFELHILGTVAHRAEVEAAVEILGLRENVIIRGYVSDEELEAALSQTDLAVNLRYPTMGEASASQLRIWNHALPSLVTQTEGYASMPADSVFFVRPRHEAKDIQKHLRHLLLRPAFFREKGRRARQRLSELHAPSVYVDRLREGLEELGAMRSRRTRLEVAGVVGRKAPWLSGPEGEARTQQYAREIASLF